MTTTTLDQNTALAWRAAGFTLDLYLDEAFSDELHQYFEQQPDASPWLLCYRAMELRLVHGDYMGARQFAEQAATTFQQAFDTIGYARATVEAATAQYHLGQHMLALAKVEACPIPEDATCVAALHFAAYLNYLGLDLLGNAMHEARQSLSALDAEPNEARRVHWQIVIQRNFAAALHFAGDLAAAQSAAAEAVRLSKLHHPTSQTYFWSCYELGVLQHRAGQLMEALEMLRHTRSSVEQSAAHRSLLRWLLVAEARVLQDMARYDEAAECYFQGGWGEGDDGPLMLWLLQGKHTEARCAAESHLQAAYASASPVVVTNLRVFLSLLDLEMSVTPAIRTLLHAASHQYASSDFWYNHASVLFHLAFAEYALGDEHGGDLALITALRFGAERGYTNFAWWHPDRMKELVAHAIKKGFEPAYCTLLLGERMGSSEKKRSITIQCLGKFEVWVDEQMLSPKQWRGHAAGAVRMQRMFLFFARQRKPHSIPTIARYVWPDKRDSIDVVHNFHVTLNSLRRVLEPRLSEGSNSSFILTTPQGYQLSPAFGVAIDVDEFLDLIRTAQQTSATENNDAARFAYEQAAQHYTGDFALSKADLSEAERYRTAFIDVIGWLARDAFERADFNLAITYARRLLEEDHADEKALHILVRTCLRSGNRRAARRYYDQLTRLHGRSAETQALGRDLDLRPRIL